MEQLTKMFEIAFSAFYVLFIPGFLASYIFFGMGKIDLIERIALSFALSISLVPLIVFYTNLAGLKISLDSVFFQILGIILVEAVILAIKWKKGLL